MEFSFNNRAKIDTTRVKTDEGYLDLNAVIYRSGTFEFSRNELPSEGMPESVKSKSKITLNVRDESVQDARFLNSAGFKPVTDGHPSDFLNVKTARYIQRGTTKGPATTSRGAGVELVNSAIRVVDENLVNLIESGELTETSIGNSGSIDWTPGVRNGVAFDGDLVPLKVNHIAIVNRGRGGRDVRLLNNDKEQENMEKVTKIVNGIQVQISKDDEALFNTLTTKIENSETEIATLNAEIENHKVELAKKDEEIKNATVSDEDIVRLVNEKSETVKSAQLIFKDVDVSKSATEIKVEAINSVNPELLGVDASADVINAVFSTLSKVERTESQDAGKKVQEVINGEAPEKGKTEVKVLNGREGRSARRKKNFQTSQLGRK